MNIHSKEFLNYSDIFIFTSSYNRHQLVFSGLAGGYVNDIDDSLNYNLNKVIPF